MNYSVFDGGNFKFYFDLLIEISSNYFIKYFFGFPKKDKIFGVYSKMYEKSYKLCYFSRKPVFLRQIFLVFGLILMF